MCLNFYAEAESTGIFSLLMHPYSFYFLHCRLHTVIWITEKTCNNHNPFLFCVQNLLETFQSGFFSVIILGAIKSHYHINNMHNSSVMENKKEIYHRECIFHYREVSFCTTYPYLNTKHESAQRN